MVEGGKYERKKISSENEAIICGNEIIADAVYWKNAGGSIRHGC